MTDTNRPLPTVAARARLDELRAEYVKISNDPRQPKWRRENAEIAIAETDRRIELL